MSALTTPHLDVRRADDRFTTRIGWLDSKHSFSFNYHHDAANTHHGLLMVNNDDIVTPGYGFDTHPHQDMEIVTWVLRGSLVHQDSTGHSGVIYPGLAQRMSAGTGILHSEKNDSWRFDGATGTHADQHDDPVHFIQMWVLPDEAGITPGYEQLEIDSELLSGGLVPVASGMKQYTDHSAIRIANKYATMHVARIQPGQHPITLPDAPFLHRVERVGLGAVATLGAFGPVEFDDEFLTAFEQSGQAGTVPTGSLDRPHPHRAVLVGEVHQLLVAVDGGREGLSE